MLIIAKSFRDLSFEKLMLVYREGNQENGAVRWPEEPPQRQIALAEEDFRDYLLDVFFRERDAVYLIWEEAERYVSALRLEPYQDGLLLEALETAPEERRKGYGSALVRQAQDYLCAQGDLRLYSHVNRRNHASLKTHFSCGFQKQLDCARLIDGSVDSRCVTLVWEK